MIYYFSYHDSETKDDDTTIKSETLGSLDTNKSKHTDYETQHDNKSDEDYTIHDDDNDNDSDNENDNDDDDHDIEVDSDDNTLITDPKTFYDEPTIVNNIQLTKTEFGQKYRLIAKWYDQLSKYHVVSPFYLNKLTVDILVKICDVTRIEADSIVVYIDSIHEKKK